ncbi:helix-turn-helix transcriptional regulator [Leucobacter chromiireducens]|uniref:LuxR family transcriptional regulator n=1 Tax=Leucobacter chromiireducens subsp. chromiireducens TaxID=660067 RepID=A0ABS1SMU9_9MICO|nr:helix-turn-helix transcriptional regulator [Leucobacter chromiireducens]MBL3689474.1 LuxR family transcriptional regulator [Leucobacter chromiireducens subsp. chromiireducens]
MEQDTQVLLAAAHAAVSDGNIDEAVQIILSCWIGVLTGPHFLELDALCARLPHAAAEDPRILAVRACAQDAQGTDKVAQLLLARALTLAEPELADPESMKYPDLEWHVSFARMILLDNREEVIKYTDRVWTLLEGVQIEARSRAAAFHHIGWAFLRHRGAPAQGVQALQFAVREAAAVGDVGLQNRAARHLSYMLAWVGKFRHADEVLQSIREIPEPGTPWQLSSVGDVEAAEAYLGYWTNDLGRARRSVERLRSDDGQIVSFAGTARVLFVLSAAASRDPAFIRQAAHKLRRIPQQDARGVSWRALNLACQAAIAEATGHRERALAIAQKFTGNEGLPLVIVALAGILRRAGKVDEAVQMLQHLQPYQQLSYVNVAMLATAATQQFRSGHPTVAHELCERALNAATEENIRRPFCEWDLEMRKLLTAHLAWGTKHETFIVECLADEIEASTHHSLTKRELLVLAQLRTTQTLAEIAEVLGVSLNTVKTQATSIYRKLGVSSRREAVAVLMKKIQPETGAM